MNIIKLDNKEYFGKWIAFKALESENDVIAFDEDVEKVKAIAKEKGYENPFLLFIPKKSIYVH